MRKRRSATSSRTSWPKGWASIQKGAAQAECSQGSLTIRLNMPVVRKDQVWLDHSHYVGVTPFERVTQPNLSDLRRLRGSNQVSNESLILAQNQRWRRA